MRHFSLVGSGGFEMRSVPVVHRVLFIKKKEGLGMMAVLLDLPSRRISRKSNKFGVKDRIVNMWLSYSWK